LQRPPLERRLAALGEHPMDLGFFLIAAVGTIDQSEKLGSSVLE